MITRRITYIVLFVFFTWLALATRHHSDWFFPVVAKYGGDVIWAGMFFFLLRVIFPRTKLVKLVVCNYLLGVLDEVSQLWHTPILDSIRSTTIGKLALGLGFMWSDIACYAVGTVLAYFFIILLERIIPVAKEAKSITTVK
ncbi:MAG TPA: DUF2809 domain-containing protein [Panacibacter sp.]|nr:DUF2809 domain-containing protein [Panacibacter sp.]HNP45581.1 DUF2809 domain-containing protein [Panacibacter sp.]